jgi:hypothetical protein
MQREAGFLLLSESQPSVMEIAVTEVKEAQKRETVLVSISNRSWLNANIIQCWGASTGLSIAQSGWRSSPLPSSGSGNT